jgi:hypothetical protein
MGNRLPSLVAHAMPGVSDSRVDVKHTPARTNHLAAFDGGREIPQLVGEAGQGPSDRISAATMTASANPLTEFRQGNLLSQ